MAVASLVLGHAAPLHAQDTNYWTQHYGTRGQLLAGIVVGSVSDLSATFYNPGALALMEKPGLLLSAKAFELQNLRLDPDPINALELSSTTFGPAPTMFAGTFSWDLVEGNQWAYSALTRQDFKARISAPGGGLISDVEVGGEFLIDQSLNETWAGLTWSLPISETFGFGATGYGVYRGQRTRLQNISLFERDSTVANRTTIKETSYWNARTLMKFGISFAYHGYSFGFSATTPSLSLFGDGSILTLRSFTGEGQPGTAGMDYEQGLSARFRSPVSIAGGVYRRFGKTDVHLSGEWFGTVSEINVLVPEEALPATYAAGNLFNAGVGVEHRFSEHFSTVAGFATDYSSYVHTPNSVSVATWNIYHVNLGVAFDVASVDLTLAANYAWGRSAMAAFEAIDPPPSGSDIVYQRLRFIVGFEFPL